MNNSIKYFLLVNGLIPNTKERRNVLNLVLQEKYDTTFYAMLIIGVVTKQTLQRLKGCFLYTYCTECKIVKL